MPQVTKTPRLILLGSYPPRECGNATFAHNLIQAFDRQLGTQSHVIALNESDAVRHYGPEVVRRMSQQRHSDYRRIAEFVNQSPSEIVSIQHEYGLFGGMNGEWLIETLSLLQKPSVLTMHTVLPKPDENMLRVTQQLCKYATKIVVLSKAGCTLLEHVYGVDPKKLQMIHHGVPDVPFVDAETVKATLGLKQRMIISTFGLINRDKGLEYTIQAMRKIIVRHPNALYLILGKTHPLVIRHEGESYRETLQEMVDAYGLHKHVQLVDHYLTSKELLDYLAATDVYVTPYLNPKQIGSGALAYAMGCGKAIISTPYPYAKELLADELGFIVPFRDSDAIAEQVIRLLDDQTLRHAIEQRAYLFSRQMIWDQVVLEYGRLFEQILAHKASAPADSA